MFDTSKEFVVRILSGTEKRCVVRWPTDVEWCNRARRIKSIRRMLGRGKSEYEPGDLQTIDAEFLATIRKAEQTVELDGAEASAIVDRLGGCSIAEVSRSGDTFRLELRHFGSDMAHVLKTPTNASEARVR